MKCLLNVLAPLTASLHPSEGLNSAALFCLLRLDDNCNNELKVGYVGYRGSY